METDGSGDRLAPARQEQQSPGDPAWHFPDAPTRHDGWTGDRMAKFCEVLAETGVVAEACEVACKSVAGAYALRRRSPIFAAAWEAAPTIARERLADTLLARSIEGNIEQIYRDGELVGERHVIDNRLGLAILRRLDRLAETGAATLAPRPHAPAASSPPVPASRGAALPASAPPDWELMLNALRTGNSDDIAEALAEVRRIEGDKVEEVEDPPNRPGQGDSGEPKPARVDDRERTWQDEFGTWWTDFPPPEDFTGIEDGEWGEYDYKRRCTDEEEGLLEGVFGAQLAAERAGDESERNSYFAELAAELRDLAALAAGQDSTAPTPGVPGA